MKSLEKLTDEQLVVNLESDEMLTHVRHRLLNAAKDLLTKPDRHGMDITIGLHCVDTVMDLQKTIETAQEMFGV